MADNNKLVVTEEAKTSIMEILAKKFSSRKFILSFIGAVTGVLGMFFCNDSVIAIVAFALLEGLSIVGYCIIEGKVDANAVKATTTVVNEIVDLLNEYKQTGSASIPTDKEHMVNDDMLPDDAEK